MVGVGRGGGGRALGPTGALSPGEGEQEEERFSIPAELRKESSRRMRLRG